jgi:hypothetical protein
MKNMKASTQPVVGEHSAERRRSQRVHITMPVAVHGKNGHLPFTEDTRTVSVNAHGCMVRLAEIVVRGQKVAVVNPRTVEELSCTVASIGQQESGKTEVGLEFIAPSPLFWGMTFPSEHWDPSERKRTTSTKTRGNYHD